MPEEKMKKVQLNNGVCMPAEGMGVFRISDGKECENTVLQALEEGYRLFDTARMYGNEGAVGNAIRKSGISREEIFIVSKLWIQDADEKHAGEALEDSLEKMGLSYMDLYLVHQPYGDYYGAWRALEQKYQEGKVRAIGVCNFSPERLVDLCIHSKIRPQVNQIEIHPFLHQKEYQKVVRDYEIQLMAWAPLSEGGHGIFEHPVLSKIGEKYHKTAAQVALRWNIERGNVVIPKTVHREYMKENLDIWDFSLDEEDRKQIDTLDIGYSEIINHQATSTVRMLCNWKLENMAKVVPANI